MKHGGLILYVPPIILPPQPQPPMYLTPLDKPYENVSLGSGVCWQINTHKKEHYLLQTSI